MAEPLGPAQLVAASVPAADHARPNMAVLGRRHETALLLFGLLVAIAVRAILIPVNGGWGDLDQFAEWVHRLAADVPFGSAERLDISYMPGLVGILLCLIHRLIPVNGGWGDLDQFAEWVHRLATDVPFGSAYRLDISYMPVLVGIFLSLIH